MKPFDEMTKRELEDHIRECQTILDNFEDEYVTENVYDKYIGKIIKTKQNDIIYYGKIIGFDKQYRKIVINGFSIDKKSAQIIKESYTYIDMDTFDDFGSTTIIENHEQLINFIKIDLNLFVYDLFELLENLK